jgi:DNA-binding CsgD family transcriptional regulator
MKLSNDPMLQLVDRIYDAALAPEAWPGVVQAIASFMGNSKAKLFTPLLPVDKGGLGIAIGIPEAADRVWATQYRDDDVWVTSGVGKGLMWEGNVVTDDDLVPEEEFVRSRIYREHLRHLEIGRLCCGVVFDMRPSDTPATVISAARELGRPYRADEKDAMRLLVPHLSRALGVMYRLRDAELKVAVSLAALDRLPVGVALLDRGGRIAHVNREGARILDEGDGLRRNGGFAIATEAARAEWSRILLSLFDRSLGAVPHFSDAVAVPRASARSPLVLQAAPLGTTQAFAAPADAAAVVFITDPDQRHELDIATMRDLYRTTPAEAALAELLCRGQTVAQAAAARAISEATARTQLGELFRKTGTNRQADLIRVLMSLRCPAPAGRS